MQTETKFLSTQFNAILFKNRVTFHFIHVRFINEAFSMDFNLFHDCQEFLFTFAFSLFACLFYFIFGQNAALALIRLARDVKELQKVQKTIFINILIRLPGHESR